jgi:hypothetical protein
MSLFVFALVAMVALVICIGCLIVLHLVPSGLHPMRDPVSLYGTTRYSVLYRVQAIASGICALCLLLALTEQHIPLPSLGLLMLACYGIARIAIAAFMMDAHGKRTLTGSIHILLAAVAFTTIAVAVGMDTASLLLSPLWNGLSVFLSLAEYLTIISALLFLLVSLLPVLRPFTGLIERGIYLGALCWLALVIIPLIR